MVQYKQPQNSSKQMQSHANLKKELHWPIETCQMGKQISRVYR